MKTYKYEHSDGLTAHLQNNSIAVASPIEKVLAFANPNQEDLFYIESVLASVGWNDNDDVFDKTETFSARNTPVDKQFNFMHKERDIIGHITSSKIVSNGEIIPDDTELDNIPDNYDILVGSVLYRHWQDPELQDRMNQIIAEIQENKWSVSMECLFGDFAYALISPTSEYQTLARNSQTSFLTKHLRSYGGTGEYQGYKVGRLLKGFNFSGKGLVTDPANKRSVILNFSDTSDIDNEFKVNASKERTMDAEKTIEMLETKLAASEKMAKETADKAVAGQISDFEKQVAELQSKLEVQTDELKVSAEKLIVAEEIQTNKATELETVQAELDSVKTELATKTEELGKIEAEKALA